MISMSLYLVLELTDNNNKLIMLEKSKFNTLVHADISLTINLY